MRHPQSEPVNPAELPDPEQITEADLPPAPPRPSGTQRRFGGTNRQIRGALTFYKICAWLTGILLLLLVAEMVLKYGFNLELFAGGTRVGLEDASAAGATNVLGFHPAGEIVDGINISLLILIVHGWMYVVYLLASFRLWSLMRWNGMRLLLMAGGGVVPFLSFIVEKQIHRQTVAEVQAHPEAVRRY